MPQEVLDLAVPTGASLTAALAVVGWFLKWRSSRDEEIRKTNEELERRLRKQEIRCEGTSARLLTRLDGFDELQKEQNGKLDKLDERTRKLETSTNYLVEWARNGGKSADQ